ncbi:MAG: AAA family ATPase [Candidatus Eisenbacteria bacterium]|nr:AAA family ATPase [Candidatus Eisenbacteria bacterium]
MSDSIQPGLFGRSRHRGRRVVVTGQVGVDKKPFIEKVARLAESRGKSVRRFHVGDMMYAEAQDVRPGRILDLPLARLGALRRSVFKDILAEVDQHETVIVNTHASFRWKHGLFPAFDHDQMLALDADVYITLVDNVDAIHERLTREHDVPHALKDILVWREEEILATEVLASAVRGHGCFFVFARGVEDSTVESFYRLIFKPETKRVYPSFPMTHVMDMPDTLAEIDAFRATLAEHFITFDPGDMDEKRLLSDAAVAMQEGQTRFTVRVHDRDVEFDVAEVTSIARDIDAQIYARDFKLIDQSDMIVSFIPELPSGKPGLSSGVERELQHAFEGTKEVYVVWQPKLEPSPFITETATKVFATTEEALTHFQQKGYLESFQKPLFDPSAPPRERGRFG